MSRWMAMPADAWFTNGEILMMYGAGLAAGTILLGLGSLIWRFA